MNRQYFSIHCSSSRYRGYSIWFANDEDGIVTEGNQLLLFASLDDLHFYGERHNITMQKEPLVFYTFEIIEEWIQQPKRETIEPELFLDTWNIFKDMATSVNSVLEEEKSDSAHVYNKLFAANNLPSMNRTGIPYIPHWSKKELRILQNIMTQGVLLFNSHSRFYNR